MENKTNDKVLNNTIIGINNVLKPGQEITSMLSVIVIDNQDIRFCINGLPEDIFNFSHYLLSKKFSNKHLPEAISNMLQQLETELDGDVDD